MSILKNKLLNLLDAIEYVIDEIIDIVWFILYG